MDSFEFNKIAGAVLGTLVLTMGLGFASQSIFKSEKPAKPGYIINVPEPVVAGASPEKAVAAEPIAIRLAKADAAKGLNAAKACTACHKFEKGAANGTGPALWGVIERQQAAGAGFAYSATLAEMGGKGTKWTYENMDAFIANPKAYVAGTKMGYNGMKDPAQRADLIAYLRSLADSPAALPK
jgi:cytochrome c